MTQAHLWLRQFGRRPTASAFLLLSLSVSLAGGVAALSLNTAVLWRELPFGDAASLVKLELRTHENRSRWWSGPELESIAATDAPAFASVAGYTAADFNVLSEPGRSPEALLGTLVSPEFFHVLGVRLHLGRVPEASDYRAGSPRVVLLSHELWEDRYGGDPAIVGRTIRLDAPQYLGEPRADYRVIGVLQEGTWLFWKRADLVLPLQAGAGMLADPRRHLVEHVVGRLAPGATIDGARLQARSLVYRLDGVSDPAVLHVVVDPLKSALFRDLRPQLLLVLTIAILVFALAGVNVAVNASTHAVENECEAAVRLAIGAAPRQLAVDAGWQVAITIVAAAVASLVLATWFIEIVVAYVPGGWLARVPGTANAVRVDAGAVTALALFALSVMLALSAWVYVWARRMAATTLLAAMRPADSPRSGRWRAMLVGSEVALCAASFMAATSLVSQLWSLGRVDLGVRSDRTTAVWVMASPTTYADANARARYFERIETALLRRPGIEAVGGVDLPFHFEWQTTRARAGVDSTTPPLTVLARASTPTYLDVSGIELLDGRWFERHDRPGAPLVVAISRALADSLWPGARAVGRQMQIGEGERPTLATVVAVVSDTRHAPSAAPDRIVYRPLAQVPPSWLYFLVRTAQGPVDSSSLRTAVWSVDPDQPIDGPWTIQQWVDDQTESVRFLATLTAILSGIGIVLVAAGLHGLTAYWVQTSSRELGIRRAVGASHLSIVAWFAAKWVRVIGPALAVGTLIHVGLLQSAMSAIEGLQPPTVASLVAAAGAVTLYAAFASAVALRRALRTDAQVLMR